MINAPSLIYASSSVGTSDLLTMPDLLAFYGDKLPSPEQGGIAHLTRGSDCVAHYALLITHNA